MAFLINVKVSHITKLNLVHCVKYKMTFWIVLLFPKARSPIGGKIFLYPYKKLQYMLHLRSTILSNYSTTIQHYRDKTTRSKRQ